MAADLFWKTVEINGSFKTSGFFLLTEPYITNAFTVGSVDNFISKMHQNVKDTFAAVHSERNCDMARACLGCFGTVQGPGVDPRGANPKR